MDTAARRARFPWWVIPGVAVLAAGLWALVRDVPFWNVVWYVPAWYGYLLIVDAFIYRLRGRSFVSHRRRELGAMLFWSLPFWFLFEAYNLRLENWYYVFVARSEAVQVVLSALAFATVLPACFFHAEALAALGVFRDLRWRPLRPGGRTRIVWFGLGVASLVAPLLWPRQAFPLVWGATLWIPDLVNHRVGAPSFLEDLEKGRGGRLARLLLGGLWAGVVWELFNYWARCKWVYTVPGFEDWKLFEMPVLGFLGFPVLAVAALSFYSTVCHFVRGGRSWESDDEPPARPVSRPLWACAAILATVFSATVFVIVSAQPLHPYRPLLAELEGIDETATGRLRSAGLETPELFYSRTGKVGPERLAEDLGVEAEALAKAHRHASGSGLPPPRPAVVKVWVRAARWNGEPRR